MQRRQFMQKAAALGAGAAVSSSLSAPALSQGKTEVRMVTAWPRAFPGIGTGAKRIADRISLMTEGRIQIKVFAAGEMVSPFEVFDAVAAGNAEIYHAVEYYWQKKHPAYNFFAAVPLGLTAQEISSWIHFGGGQALWDEISLAFGVKGIAAGNTGCQMAGWFRTPLKSVEDIKGLRFRMPGLGGEVLRRLGATILNISGGEILAALQSGIIDGTEWVGPSNDRAFGFHKILKTYMYPGFHEPGTVTSLGINLNWWNKLGKTDQSIIESCCAAENGAMIAEYLANDADAMDDLTKNHGVSLVRIPAEVFSAFAKMSDEVVREVGESDPLSKKIVESYFAFRKRVARITNVTDGSYTHYRNDYLGL